MTDTAIIEIALQTMVVALKLSAPDPGHLAGDRLRDLAVPVDDPDPGVHALASCPKLIGVGVALLICGNWMLHDDGRLHQRPLRRLSPTLLS